MMVHRKKGPPSISYNSRDRRFRVVDIDGWLVAKAAANQKRGAIAEAREPQPKRHRGRPTKAEVIASRR
jgi:hypothetical protein